ncbi:MAG TPA: riboflavin synthase [Myxococcota bacterium]|nr:riboflavin synthase [Myxococcota bacterium]
MFTGIVEAVGEVESAEPAGELLRLVVRAPAIAAEARVGDSVAVRGACLTVTRAEAGRLSFEAVRETLARTAVGELRAGSQVNLERALRAGGRLDGHLVQGHVDGVGRVAELRREGGDVRLFVACPPEVATHLVEKGSVAIDGVSLTVVGARDDGFDVALIPHTLAATTLGALRPGDRVNLEVDVLAKYVRRSVERILGKDGTQGAR